MVDICGKLQVLDQMIVRLMKDGHKTLIFSQVSVSFLIESSVIINIFVGTSLLDQHNIIQIFSAHFMTTLLI